MKGDGDCGYTAFVTRQQAYRLLVENIAKIRNIIKPALQEALRTQTFIDVIGSFIYKGFLMLKLSQSDRTRSFSTGWNVFLTRSFKVYCDGLKLFIMLHSFAAH